MFQNERGKKFKYEHYTFSPLPWRHSVHLHNKETKDFLSFFHFPMQHRKQKFPASISFFVSQLRGVENENKEKSCEKFISTVLLCTNFTTHSTSPYKDIQQRKVQLPKLHVIWICKKRRNLIFSENPPGISNFFQFSMELSSLSFCIGIISFMILDYVFTMPSLGLLPSSRNNCKSGILKWNYWANDEDESCNQVSEFSSLFSIWDFRMQLISGFE